MKIYSVMSNFNRVGHFLVILSACSTCGFGLQAAESTPADQVTSQRIFEQPILWVGEQPPSDAESLELLGALDASGTNRMARRVERLEQFIADNPSSAWTPSLRANVAVHYRFIGRYSRALAHWEEAWNATRQFESGSGRRVADYVLANWSSLLSSLGRLDKLKALHAATAGRLLCDLEWERRFSASRQNLSTMQVDPGVSYKCGTLALINVGHALGIDFDLNALKDLPSPATGFSLAQLVDLANFHKLDLVPARRSSGIDLVVPSIIHWQQDHYAAIMDCKDGLYRVADPTFGTTKWLTLEVINEEASGYFLVPRQKKPAGWSTPTTEEMKQIFGKGWAGGPPPPPPPPCDATQTSPDSCPKCKPGGPSGPPSGPPGGPPGPGRPGGPGGCG